MGEWRKASAPAALGRLNPCGCLSTLSGINRKAPPQEDWWHDILTQKDDLQPGRFCDGSTPMTRYKNLSFVLPSARFKVNSSAGSPDASRGLFVLDGHESDRLPPQILLSVGHSYIICADQVQNIPLRRGQREMSRVAKAQTPPSGSCQDSLARSPTNDERQGCTNT